MKLLVKHTSIGFEHVVLISAVDVLFKIILLLHASYAINRRPGQILNAFVPEVSDADMKIVQHGINDRDEQQDDRLAQQASVQLIASSILPIQQIENVQIVHNVVASLKIADELAFDRHHRYGPVRSCP